MLLLLLMVILKDKILYDKKKEIKLVEITSLFGAQRQNTLNKPQ